MRKFLSDLWARAFLRGVHYSDRHQQLDTLYRMENPWRLDSPAEQARFRLTNEIISREFGKVGSLLEIGSGEGHQSQYLLQVADNLHGREISARAVDRARQRCPQGRFEVGDLSVRSADETLPYDLVVACEVLYYMSDPQGAVEEMSRLGRNCLITYFQTQTEAIAGKVVFPAHAQREQMTYDGGTWTMVWWRNAI